MTAAERLIRLGGDVTADVIPFLGHAVDQGVLDLLIERLKGHIPKRPGRRPGAPRPELHTPPRWRSPSE